MTNKVNPPIAALSSLNLPPPLLTFLNQMWMRTGGNDDLIAKTDQEVSAKDSRKFIELRNLTRKVSSLEMSNEQLKAEVLLLRQQLKPKACETLPNIEPEIQRIKQKINDLELR